MPAALSGRYALCTICIEVGTTSPSCSNAR